MAGVYKLDIAESEEELKKLLGQQKTASDKERVQLLYLLKSKQALTIQAAATMLGRHRVTVQEWAKEYRHGGMTGILKHKPRVGKQHSIPKWAQQALDKRLHQEEGFNDYGEICQWLEQQLGIVAKYKTVHKLVRYRLKSSPKVARPISVCQNQEKVVAFKKNSLRT